MHSPAPETRQDIIEKRNGERRRMSVSTVHGAMFTNRRCNPRRDGDHVDSYTDWYGHLPLITTVTIILLCCADAFLTTVLIANGAVELNIFMDWLIQRDIHLFAIVKMAITGISLIVLVMHLNFRIYRFIYVRYVLYGLVPVYSLLFYHELNMLASI